MVFSKALARIFNCGRVFAVQVLLLSLSAVAVAGVGVAAPLGKTDEGMFLLKPGVDIPARDLRRFQSGRKNIKFFWRSRSRSDWKKDLACDNRSK